MPPSPSNSSGWRCPECGRRFLRATREHSCDITSLEFHLERTLPEVREIVAALERFLRSVGPHHVVPLKTMVTLSTVSNFGGLTFGRSFLDLALFLPRRLESPRIRQVQRLSASTLINRVRLTSAAGVDTELQAWIREAYQLSLSGGKRS